MKTGFILCLFLFSLGKVTAQWISTGCPGARLVASNNEWLFASNHTVLRSNDEGTNWFSNLSGLPQSTTNRVVCLVATDSIVFAGFGSSGLYFSTTNGAQWMVASGLPSGSVRSLVKIGNTWYAALEKEGIYKATNSTFSSWEPLNDGLPVNSAGKNFVSLTAQGSALFVCVTGAGIYYLDVVSMAGSNWFLSSQNVSSGMPLDQPTSLAFVANRETPSGFSGPFVFAGTANNGVYDSGDGGAMWDPSNPSTIFKNVFSLFAFNNALLAATDSGTFINLEYNVWEEIPNVNGKSFTVQNGFLYYADTLTVFKGPIPLQFTSKKPLLSRSNLEIFPNPASGKANIQWSNCMETVLNISVCDQVGRLVLTQNLGSIYKDGRIDLTVSSFTPGIYFVQLHGPKGFSHPAKLVIQR